MTDDSSEFGAAIGIVLEYGTRLAVLGLDRYPPETAAALRESINDGAPLVLTVELAPGTRISCKVGELEIFELSP
jgi:hypothetical protein